MSNETTTQTIQPATAVRTADAWLYCQQCGEVSPHDCRDAGIHEIYTCLNCGYQQWFAVR